VFLWAEQRIALSTWPCTVATRVWEHVICGSQFLCNLLLCNSVYLFRGPLFASLTARILLGTELGYERTRLCRILEVSIWDTFSAAVYWPPEWNYHLLFAVAEQKHLPLSNGQKTVFQQYIKNSSWYVGHMNNTSSFCRQICERTRIQRICNSFESSHEDAEPLMTEETVSGTMDNKATLTRLVAHEGFISHSCHESFIYEEPTVGIRVISLYCSKIWGSPSGGYERVLSSGI
jgi:hypothetical protein